MPTFASQNNDGAIAQLVEQRTENPCVPGSIPGGTTAKESYRNVALFCFISFNLIYPPPINPLHKERFRILSLN